MKEFFTRNHRADLMSVREIFDPSVPAEGFRLAVDHMGRAVISFSDERGLFFAKEDLKSLIRNGTVPVCEAENFPSLPLRGVVEGFYGKPYSMQQRHELLDFLSAHRMNTYLYAPKDDVFHRARWREPYPANELEELKQLAVHAKEVGVRFYYCLSPGLDFDYSDEKDFQALKEKLLLMCAIGVEDFALLFDDIDPSLNEASVKKFSSPALAHCEVVNFAEKNIPHAHPLLFCPTDYFQVGETPYRNIVKSALSPTVSVLWTGYNTVAEVVTSRDCILTKEAFGHELVLWDNYPVNDFEPKRRVYFGEVDNRTPALSQTHVGYLCNPSELFEASKVAISTAAEYAWDPEHYHANAAFLRAVKEQLGEGREATIFAKCNRSKVMRRYAGREKLFIQGDYAALDRSFSLQKKAVAYIRENKPRLAEEIEELLRYMELECELYVALRKGKEFTHVLRSMKACKYRSADQSLPAYLASKGAEDITEKERAVYWAPERGMKETSPEE